MKIVAVIQARMGSTRLPGKVLLPLEDRSVLEWVITRVSASSLVDDVVVATTISPDDLEIVKLCATIGVRVYCGSEDNVLDRYYQAGRLLTADHVLRITADCPLIDPKVIDDVVSTHLESDADFTCNTITVSYPDGLDTEIFKFKALKDSWEGATLKTEFEHVTPFVKSRPEMYRLINISYKEDLSNKRWTLDNAEDYEFLKIVFNNVYYGNPLFNMQDILTFLDKNPDLEKLNNHILRNEAYINQVKQEESFKG